MPERSPSPLSVEWWRARLTSDLPASFVVFLVALPLSMGIAIASGAPVTTGLVTGIIGGLVAGALAGAPLQVSGPAAGLTVIVYQCIQKFGIEELGVVVLAAGAMQILAGGLRLGQWFRAVSPAVVQGMLAGIGVLIVCSQFHVMVDDKPKQNGIANLRTIPEAIAKAAPWNGNDEQRVGRIERTRRLRQSSLLHLEQVEIQEEVHHALTGILAADPASGEAAAAADASSSGEQAAAERLRSLAPRQERVLELLSGDSPPSGEESPEQADARRTARQALADLTLGNVHTAREAQDKAAEAIAELRDSAKDHRWAAGIGILTILVLVAWQATFARRLRYLPAPLVAVSVATALAFTLELPVLYVEVPDNLLEEVYLPTLAELKSLANPSLLFTALQIAVIASAETLLCATAVDQMHQGPRTKYDRELIAQGVGNTLCGLLSALPMTGVIVRSGANVQAGATSRWSAVLHGLWLLLFVVGASFVLRIIPTASLAAILVYTGYKLVSPRTVRTLLVFGKVEVVIYLATLIGIVVTDLLTGVLLGIGLSVAKIVYTFSRLKVTMVEGPDEGQVSLALRGSATFLRLPKLAAALEAVPPGSELHVRLERLAYIDHACLDLLINWEKQHAATGGRMVIDWNDLTARFRSDSASLSPHPSAPSPERNGRDEAFTEELRRHTAGH